MSPSPQPPAAAPSPELRGHQPADSAAATAASTSQGGITQTGPQRGVEALRSHPIVCTPEDVDGDLEEAATRSTAAAVAHSSAGSPSAATVGGVVGTGLGSRMLQNCVVLGNRFSTYQDRWDLRPGVSLSKPNLNSKAGSSSQPGPKRPDMMLSLIEQGKEHGSMLACVCLPHCSSARIYVWEWVTAVKM